jgi:hypothetical protein
LDLIRSSEYSNNGHHLRLGAVFKDTIGVVFVDTPHRGSDKAGLAGIAKLTLRQPHKNPLRNIEEDSDIPERQRRLFASVSERLQLACLFEEKLMAIGVVSCNQLSWVDAN